MSLSNSEAPILITGVGKRLGLAMAQHFLQQGYRIIGTYRSEYPSLASLRQAGADLYPVDFYHQEALDDFIMQIKQNYPQLRALIHNASDWLEDDCDLAAYDIIERMMRIHVSAPYLMNRAFKPLLMPAENEALRDIIHISDYVADKGSRKHMAYAASKAALNNLTCSFAQAYAPGIKVNGIAPALMLFNEEDSVDYKNKALSKALLPREGGEMEFLRSVDYLLASHYITGRTLHLDGGRHLK